MKTEIERGTAKEKITKAALDLFYKQGYNATGIQQIIDEAGVSKGTFYTHFKAKDDLGVEYMRRMSMDEITHLKEALSKIKDPLEKYFYFNDMMKEWMAKTEFRGCAFANMCAEVTDCCSPIRKEAKYHYEAFRAVIRDMVEDLVKSNAKYRHLDPAYVADQYLILQIGALTNSEIYQDTWPFDNVKLAIKDLIAVKG